MSSKESCDEEQPGKTTLYRVKRHPWESEKLKRAKKALDDDYKQGLTKRAKDSFTMRRCQWAFYEVCARTLC